MPVEVSPDDVQVESRSSGSSSGSGGGAQLPPDLVNQLADRVMALLLRDLKFEHERRRFVGRAERPKGWR